MPKGKITVILQIALLLTYNVTVIMNFIYNNFQYDPHL